MNKYVKYLLLVAGSISFLFTGCYKCPACENPPLSVNFRIIDKNTSADLLYTKRYSLDTIQVFSVENGLNHRIKLDSYTDTVNKRVVLGSSDWIQKSLSGQKNYFLKLNNHDIDTVFFNVTETLSNNDCCRAEHIRNFEINGVELFHTDLGLYGVYKK
jgi:hypothetical protein